MTWRSSACTPDPGWTRRTPRSGRTGRCGRPGSPRACTTRTPSRSSTSSRTTASPASSCSTSPPAASPSCSPSTAGCRCPRSRGSAPRWPRPWPRPTPRGSCTVTSSPPTCSSPPTARRGSRDFGIAHAMGDVSLTTTGMVTGTPAYLAPEVARGGDASPASDVFSLGSTLYTAAGGSPSVRDERERDGPAAPRRLGGHRPPAAGRPAHPVAAADARGRPGGPPGHGRGGPAARRCASGRDRRRPRARAPGGGESGGGGRGGSCGTRPAVATRRGARAGDPRRGTAADPGGRAGGRTGPRAGATGGSATAVAAGPLTAPSPGAPSPSSPSLPSSPRW